MTDLTSAMPPQLADAETVDLSALVDTERYPLHDPRSPALEATIAKAREDLEREGCAVLRGFLRPERLAQMQAETARLAETAFYNTREVNAYFTADDDRLPQQDPRRLFMTRTSGFVTRDMIPADSLMQRLYVSQAMKQLVSACLGRERVYEYADPFAGLVLNVLPDGTEQPWHYDTNEFIVTMMTRQSDAGGRFEYAAGIRSPEGENFEGVEKVLDGDRSRLTAIDLKPGDLQIFFGRYSLHRVTPVRGERERHTVIFAYAKEPGFIGRPERAQRIFGRMAPIHERLLKEGMQRSDNLAD